MRLIAATNRNLPELVAHHRFREDLYYRINVFTVQIPPLRDRMNSLFLIVADLLPEICGRLGVDQKVISTEAIEKMRQYRWPETSGNWKTSSRKPASFPTAASFYPMTWNLLRRKTPAKV